jgi:hypothetical protein
MTREIRLAIGSLLCVCLLPCIAAAEVTKVTISKRTVVANGEAFGATGPYEKLVGRIEFALDPSNTHNKPIVDLTRATRGADRRVHFSADLYVLRPVDATRGNGTMLFEVANRGRKGLLERFNRARTNPRDPGSQDPMMPADFGDGFLMKEGYTLVWIGWQFDVASSLLRVEAPLADVSGRARISFVPDTRSTSIAPADFPAYAPAIADDPAATLTVRDRFWQRPSAIARKAWHLTVVDEKVRVVLDAGFQPGQIYELEYPATGDRVAGVGLAAIRDAASAFRYRADLPVQGRAAFAFGISQSGRFLRQFLHDGFNADERGRRVFDAVWPHIAGAGQGSFNERFATPGYSSFPATRFPFTDLPETNSRGVSDGLLARYRPEQLPKIFYTNTSVEYWGQGRAAALIHTTYNGHEDVRPPENVRMYLLAGTQHGEAAFPPRPGNGQALGNPTPQGNTMRALLRALHQWVNGGIAPPDSQHPRLSDGTLVPVSAVLFPIIPGVRDPRSIEGPAEIVRGRVASLPFLVPRVDADGNEVAGIRTPDISVPLATTTGWNFRDERVGNPSTIYALLGSYLPFPRTRAERESRIDPRLSVEERYRGRDDYLSRVRRAADELIQQRLMLPDDLEDVLDHAARHWSLATGTAQTN